MKVISVPSPLIPAGLELHGRECSQQLYQLPAHQFRDPETNFIRKEEAKRRKEKEQLKKDINDQIREARRPVIQRSKVPVPNHIIETTTDPSILLENFFCYTNS